jgi:hypothetical protein
MDYYAGYGTDTIVFQGSSVAQQRFGELQPASSDPIGLGSTDLVDSESNNFTKTGISTSETHTPIFIVETRQRVRHSSNSGEARQTSSGTPISND